MFQYVFQSCTIISFLKSDQLTGLVPGDEEDILLLELNLCVLQFADALLKSLPLTLLLLKQELFAEKPDPFLKFVVLLASLRRAESPAGKPRIPISAHDVFLSDRHSGNEVCCQEK